jgi:hypothetical protein
MIASIGRRSGMTDERERNDGEPCGHEVLGASLDRWHECHWHIHNLETYYHHPEPFRYSFNSFLRAVKEVPQLMKMELQPQPRFRELKRDVDALYKDPLLELLHHQRNFLVHQGSLKVLSKGNVGVAKGLHSKFQMNFNVAPFESSDEAYERFKEACRQHKDYRSLAGPHGDDVRPYIRREWRIPELPGLDLLDAAVTAWRQTGQVLSNVVTAIGARELDLSLSCRHEPAQVRVKEYSVYDFYRTVDGLELERGDDEGDGDGEKIG